MASFNIIHYDGTHIEPFCRCGCKDFILLKQEDGFTTLKCVDCGDQYSHHSENIVAKDEEPATQ